MVRIVIETSIPACTVPGVRSRLAPESLPAGVRGHIEEPGNTGLCAGPARGGAANWTPCYISLECPAAGHPGFQTAVRDLRRALVEAARQGGTELLAVPAAVQMGDSYFRVRDLEALPLLAPMGD